MIRIRDLKVRDDFSREELLLFACQKKVLELIIYLINNSFNNTDKLETLLKYMENYLIECCNSKICINTA